VIRKKRPDPLGDPVERVFVRTDLFTIYKSGDRARYYLDCEEERARALHKKL